MSEQRILPSNDDALREIAERIEALKTGPNASDNHVELMVLVIREFFLQNGLDVTHKGIIDTYSGEVLYTELLSADVLRWGLEETERRITDRARPGW